jgi:hypothetical protein
MIYGGQYFCRIRELKPIEFGMYEMVSTTEQQQQHDDVERQTENGIQTQSS